MDVICYREQVCKISEPTLTPKQVAQELKRIANDIDKADQPSQQRVASTLKRLQTKIRPIKRMATPTTIEVDVTDNEEYDRMMDLLSR